MALIPETGAIVADADTYVTVAEATAFALKRGVELPADEDAAEILLIKAMDWLESLSVRYQGCLVSSTQSLQWPRTGVIINGFEFAEDAIPRALKNAQCQVAMDIYAGIDPQENFTATPAVIKEKVDVLETTYTEVNQDSVPYLRKALDFLEPLFGTANTGATYFSVRV